MPHTPISRLGLLLVLKYPPMPVHRRNDKSHTQQSLHGKRLYNSQVIAMRMLLKLMVARQLPAIPPLRHQQDYSGPRVSLPAAII
jgi:hypothetical protein